MPAAQLIPALLLLFPAVWVMGAIAAALATRFEPVTNLLVCLFIFSAGLVLHYLAGQWMPEGMLRSFVKALVPNWQYFWMADALSNGQIIPFSYVLLSLLYVFIYIVIWSLWAFWLFFNRELAKDSR